jgi:hypothetical protein
VLLVALLCRGEAHIQFTFEGSSPEHRFEFMADTIVPQRIGM